MKAFKIILLLPFILLLSCSPKKEETRPSFTDTSNPGNNACVSVDTDGDGIMDCQDPDVDNDGFLNQIPPVAINFACYRQISENDCLYNVGSLPSCTWTANNKCVTVKSCGVKLTESDCSKTAGCNWSQNSNSCEQADWFPYAKAEHIDSDFDGVGDSADPFPNDPTETVDTDQDGLGNNVDADDDNDGVPDRWDTFPLNLNQYADIDFDGLGDNNLDPDSDNDGVPNFWDDVLWSKGGFDIDKDLLTEAFDADLDGDGVLNELDAFPWDKTEWVDSDGDRLGNNLDPDDDNDGIPDVWDDFPLRRDRAFDADKDGYANEDDKYPYDPTEWADTDGDGVGDNKDAFPTDPFEWSDTDLDGIGDNQDVDSDNDGFFNQIGQKEFLQVSCYKNSNAVTCGAESGCAWTTQNRCVPVGSCGTKVTVASCGGTVGCGWNGISCEQLDMLPLDKKERFDNDLDLIGDNADADDDNDGIPDQWDELPFRSEAYMDFDGDGLIDWELPTRPIHFTSWPEGQYALKVDPDSDNDGVPDFWDDLAWNANEYADIDKDGIGNNQDLDKDGDGVVDSVDYYPYDNSESGDNDADGLGNNVDADDDNDGVPDAWDTLSFNSRGFSDLNNNGVPDQDDIDIDGDGTLNGCDKSNGNKYCITCVESATTPGVYSCSYINGDANDAFPWDKTEWTDTDNDTLGNNVDPDDDNDGVPDSWDTVPLDSRGFADLDQDSIPDSVDDDMDGDGSPNGAFMCVTNNGLITCGYLEGTDVFPWEKGESVDTDNDGIGNTTDADDDNDGVPDFWDDFPLDKNYWADNDGDSIPNENDTFTPNGINSEAELETAIIHGENLALTGDFAITKCHNIAERIVLISAKGRRTLTYTGPSDGCMFNVTGDFVGIVNVNFNMPKTKQGVIVKSTTAVDSLVLAGNELNIYGQGKIADILTDGSIGFIRNNIILNTKQNISNNYKDLISIKTNSPDTKLFDANHLLFSGNIAFWNVSANQTNSISLVRTDNPIRSLKLQNNVINFTTTNNATLTNDTALFNINFDGLPGRYCSMATTAPACGAKSECIWSPGSSECIYRPDQTIIDNSVTVSDNRINQSVAKLVALSSSKNTLDMPKQFIASENLVYGLSTLGSNLLDVNQNAPVVNCAQFGTAALCGNQDQCVWNANSCQNTNLPVPSFKAYYDFKASDVWLSPENGDFHMFYYPQTAKMAKSPALFSAKVQDPMLPYAQVEEAGLNGQASIFYVGAYGPAIDSDGDGFSDDIDKFKNNINEWFDSDFDGIGNNADTDNDNDGLLNTLEHSYCAPAQSAYTCGQFEGCAWDKEKTACLRTYQGCMAGSSWDAGLKCCTDAQNNCVDGTDPFQVDTDGDGLTDAQENNQYHTNPLIKDTDGDGVSDRQETIDLTNPNDPLDFKDSDHDGLSDDFETNSPLFAQCVNQKDKFDSDNDGLSDGAEVKIHHTNPCLADTDGDGFSDGVEIAAGTDPLDPLDKPVPAPPAPAARMMAPEVDSDGDGISDSQERLDGTDPENVMSFKDTDADGESDYADKTPYGVWPCSNQDLSACGEKYSDQQVLEAFKAQLNEVQGCATKTDIRSCEDSEYDLCQWENNQCSAKDLILYKSLNLTDSCFTIGNGDLSTKVTIKSPLGKTFTITAKNDLTNTLSCTQAFNHNHGVFHVTPNARLTLKGLIINLDNEIKAFISTPLSTKEGSFSVGPAGTEFSGGSK